MENSTKTAEMALNGWMKWPRSLKFRGQLPITSGEVLTLLFDVTWHPIHWMLTSGMGGITAALWTSKSNGWRRCSKKFARTSWWRCFCARTWTHVSTFFDESELRKWDRVAQLHFLSVPPCDWMLGITIATEAGDKLRFAIDDFVDMIRLQNWRGALRRGR